MGINNSAITSRGVTDTSFPSIIELLDTRPVPGELFVGTRSPGQLAAYHDAQRGVVELFVVNNSGTRWLGVV